MEWSQQPAPPGPGSEELRVFDLTELRSVLARNQGHRGTAPLSRALAIYELDVYWSELRFAVELDVYATHGTHEPFEEDRRRNEDLKLAGIELTRVTDRIARLLEQRRRQLAAGTW